MKVSELIKQLADLSPDDDICALYWERPVYDSEDEIALPKRAWAEICDQFDSWDNRDKDLSHWIADAVIEKVETFVN